MVGRRRSEGAEGGGRRRFLSERSASVSGAQASIGFHALPRICCATAALLATPVSHPFAATKKPHFRGVEGFTDYYAKYGQSEPPSCEPRDLPYFKEKGSFPEGEILEHGGDFNTHRITSEEKRA